MTSVASSPLRSRRFTLRQNALVFAVSSCFSVVVGCAGRNAAWNAKESTPHTSAPKPAASTPSTAPAKDPTQDPTEMWWSKRDQPDAIVKVIQAWEVEAGCRSGNEHPSQRCADIQIHEGQRRRFARLTRAHYFWADAHLRDQADDYLDVLDRGVWWGELALVAASPKFKSAMDADKKFVDAIALVDRDGVPAMYWYAAALGKWAKRKSFAVLLGQKDNIKATMSRVSELDPAYFHSAPDRYFGAYFAVAPKFAGGDLEKSRTHFDRSVANAPEYLGTKVLMAQELAVRLDDRALFESLLNSVLATPNSQIPPELWPESEVERIKAKELLAQIDELF